MFALVADYTIGTTVLSIISGVAGYAGRDAWIVALVTPFMGLPVLWMFFYLNKLFPGKTLVEIIQDVFGKWVGWIVSAYFVFFLCFLSVSEVVFYMGNFVKSEYMTETPLYAFNTLLVITIAVGLLYGIETIGRSSEIFLYIISFLILLTILLDLPNIKTDNLFPVLENGIAPVLKGCLYLNSFLALPLIVFAFFYPLNVADVQKSRKSFFGGYFWASFLGFLCTIMSIFILGATITAKTNYPTYLFSKEINISSITRFEGFITFSWMFAEFIKVSIYSYAGLVGFTQLFGLKGYKKMVIPIGISILVFSGVVYPNIAYQQKWDSTTWVVSVGTFGFVLPAALIIGKKIKDVIHHVKAMETKEKAFYDDLKSLLYLCLAAIIIILSLLLMKFLL